MRNLKYFSSYFKVITGVAFVFLSSSCADQQSKDNLLKENKLLKAQIAHLEKVNAQLNVKLETQSAVKSQIKETSVKGLQYSKVMKVHDQRLSKDTLELEQNGKEFVFERIVEFTQLDNKLFAETFGSIKERKTFMGYTTFSICDGPSLPLEMCNCTDSMYIVIEPEELGEAYELYRIGFFYDVDLISLERLDKDHDDIILTFKHGKYPRKTEKISLTKMKLEK